MIVYKGNHMKMEILGNNIPVRVVNILTFSLYLMKRNLWRCIMFFEKVQVPQKENSHSSKSKHSRQISHLNYKAIIQRIKMNPQSMTQADTKVLQHTIGNQAVGKLMSEIGFRKKEAKKQENLNTGKENAEGLPDNLKAGVENLSGLSMDDIRVHYNSDKPSQVGALAYTQGKDIHVAPGQEKHLPHEAWHVVQQAQGRVSPTIQLKGIQINDDGALESEADEKSKQVNSTNNSIERRNTDNLSNISQGSNIIQKAEDWTYEKEKMDKELSGKREKDEETDEEYLHLGGGIIVRTSVYHQEGFKRNKLKDIQRGGGRGSDICKCDRNGDIIGTGMNIFQKASEKGDDFAQRLFNSDTYSRYLAWKQMHLPAVAEGAMKPKKNPRDKEICPKCTKRVYPGKDCGSCGQKINWS